ncbi:MAG: Kynureninase (L-kynurenine hydrolase) [Cirrosporium novae-zelandiae]|nr:MAG: Kynureninase (L-kynurenine hydrolase) [Cirrosporium novae-zelandiae]
MSRKRAAPGWIPHGIRTLSAMAKLFVEESFPTREYAQLKDEVDPLHYLRSEFTIPTRGDLKRKTLYKTDSEKLEDDDSSIYLCGNSLGLQPKCLPAYINAQLAAWATKGVVGHFVEHSDSPVPPFLHVDDIAAKKMAPIVGAKDGEVAVMGNLTANLHFMLDSFYRPDGERTQIIMEENAFPSDRYAVESHIISRGLDPSKNLILIPSYPTLSIPAILDTITAHTKTAALVLFGGVQYLTGQLLPMKKIAAHAHMYGITTGFDLAHAVGNVPLSLHDWDIDFAVWCSYKYLNAGPGAIAGLFIHEKHDFVQPGCTEGNETTAIKYRPRLSGWWGADKASRFAMSPHFVPRPGAAGYQLSNPSCIDIASLLASLSIFEKTSMSELRSKSVGLTEYLEDLLWNHQPAWTVSTPAPFKIITPNDPQERGAQLSLQFDNPKLLEKMLAGLEKEGIIVDERKPDVIRVSPAPLYNSYEDVWVFCHAFWGILHSIMFPDKRGGG